LNFDIVAEEILEDRTNRIILRVAPEDLVYLGYILESFEGWCNYIRTPAISGNGLYYFFFLI